ncbi:SWIM zinc finger family protein [Caldibacillus lycopersici]|uniref:SWIM zinc finger family protein n=1 Tax=Perspicuibacillus lycopersici TaxID=1325689 RepID=A0AAE3LQA4_9BACI|nr:SWIM zinc finger family protein [Perspicuibacillus lycopersici]MCU9613269.1 SWIM zinc finger family protein [Perspicuibacillus lycopersici]
MDSYSPAEFVLSFSAHLNMFLNPNHPEDERAVQKGLLLYNQKMVRSLKMKGPIIFGHVQDVIPVQVKLHMDLFTKNECSCPAVGYCRHILAVFFSLYGKHHSVNEWLESWRAPQQSLFSNEASNSELPKEKLIIKIGQKTVVPATVPTNKSQLLAPDPQERVEDRLTDQEMLSLSKQSSTTILDSKGASVSDMQFSKNEPTNNQGQSTGDNLYDFWVHMTDEIFQGEVLQRNSLYPYLMNLYGHAALRQLENPILIRRENMQLYKIVTNVRLLQQLQELFLSSKYSTQEIEDTCAQLVHTILHNVENATEQLPQPIPLSLDSLIVRLQREVRELLFLEGPFPRQTLLIYWALWTKLFTSRQLRDDELTFAEDIAKKSNPDSVWVVAYVIQLFLAGKVEQALDQLNKSGPHNFFYIFQFIDHYASEGNWKGITSILPFLIQHIKDYFSGRSYQENMNYVRYTNLILSDYVSHTNRMDLYEQVLIEMLPYSARSISDLYFDNEDYYKLMDFLQLTGMSMDVIVGEKLRKIQKDAPDSLLPLYHQHVVASIEKKNRSSYKEAVRYLKKLRTIYKKIKKEAVWELYFANLLQDTKRLRAFQEECQRGKLIDVENETV